MEKESSYIEIMGRRRLIEDEISAMIEKVKAFFSVSGYEIHGKLEITGKDGRVRERYL